MKLQLQVSYRYHLMTREQYMDAIDQIIQDTREFGLIEAILTKHGASEDDSDPDEGYFVTMSDDDIQAAYKEILDSVGERVQELNPDAYYKLLSSKQYALSDYEAGWIDGYEAACY